MHVTSASPVVVPAAMSPVTPPLAAAGRAWTVAGLHAAGLYLTAPDGPGMLVMPVIGIGASDLPTALRTHVAADIFTSGLALGDEVWAEADRLLLPAAELRIRRTWRPARISVMPQVSGTPTDSACGTAAALPVASAVLQPGIDDAEVSAEGIVAAALDAGQDAAPCTDRPHELLAARIAALIGRGPGLTPSGDDVLSGIALALRWQSEWCALAQFRTALTPQLNATTAISASLLAAALDGWCTTAVKHALTAAHDGDMPTFAAQLGAIGHTSGHDLGAGVLATWRTLSRHSPRSAGGSPLPTEGEDRALTR